MISFSCTCGKKLQVKDEFAGKEGKCPSCGSTMLIPGRDSPPQAEPIYRTAARDTDPDDFDAGGPAGGNDQRPRRDNGEDEPRREKPRRKKRSRVDGADSWEPPNGMNNHGGSPVGSKEEFFAPPPEEIGEVLSAHSSMRTDSEPMSPGTRLTIAIVAGAVGLIVGIVIAVNLTDPFWQIFWPLLLAGTGLGVALLVTRFSHNCTYVGREGVARFWCSGGRDNITSDVFCFADASELRTSQTRHYTNGAYQNTQYSFTWTDVTGRTRFTVTGSHRSEQGTPPNKDPYHFATSAEMAWTVYLLNQVQAQLQLQGSIYFGLGGKDWVRLGEERMTLHFRGETTECHADDIAQVRIEQGWFQVRRKDAKEGWFSSYGVFKFPYGNLANAQLFLILLDKLVGVQVN